jgi:4,5-DOPA dioxygenase extradiol
LASLRAENVLVIGSGHITHNLREVIGLMRGKPVTPGFGQKVSAFTDWFHGALTAGDERALAGWKSQAPFVTDNHPTDEHLLPLFTAFGAAGEEATGERIHNSTEFDGIFAWDAYRFT